MEDRSFHQNSPPTRPNQTIASILLREADAGKLVTAVRSSGVESGRRDNNSIKIK
jgi:hypothetical protein